MAKICNQTFIKDQFRDKKYIGTMKCIFCGEESNISLKFPCSLLEFNKQLQQFTKMHTVKGCNKTKLDAPDWACKTFEVGIAAG
jgi:hypothetical protein